MRKIQALLVVVVTVFLLSTSSVSAGSEPKKKKNKIYVSALLPNPKGTDRGNEWVEVTNGTNKSVDLKGWQLKDKSKHVFKLIGKLAAGKKMRFKLPGTFPLTNTGDTISLLDAGGKEVDSVSYIKGQATDGTVITFEE